MANRHTPFNNTVANAVCNRHQHDGMLLHSSLDKLRGRKTSLLRI